MACALYKKGWLNQNGTLDDSIKMRYDEIPGVSENINRCLGLDFDVSPLVQLVEVLRCIREALKNKNLFPVGACLVKIRSYFVSFNIFVCLFLYSSVSS